MGTVKGRLIATDSDLKKSFLSCNGEETVSHLLRRIKSSNLFGLRDDVPGPTEKTPQTTPHAVRSSNPSIIGGRSKPVVSPFLTGTDKLRNLLG
jgi:hypothetical protein